MVGLIDILDLIGMRMKGTAMLARRSARNMAICVICIGVVSVVSQYKCV
jgi:hypothetical protein